MPTSKQECQFCKKLRFPWVKSRFLHFRPQVEVQNQAAGTFRKYRFEVQKTFQNGSQNPQKTI